LIRVTNGILIGLSLLAGVAGGLYGFLIVLPAAIIFAIVRKDAYRGVTVIACVCVTVGFARGAMMHTATGAGEIGDSAAATGVITSLPVAGGDSERSTLRLERIRSADGSWSDATGKVIVYLPNQHDGISLFDRVTVVWRASGVQSLAPGYASFVRAEGAIASARVWTYQIEAHGPEVFEHLADTRRSVSDALVNALPGDSGALAAGIVTGDDSGLGEEAENAFRRTGTAHVTSVSGQNIALLVGFLSLWLRPHTAWSRAAVHTTLVLAVWLYAVMVGLEPPALRAATVATLTILGAYSGRRPDPLTLLALTLGVMAVIDPTMPRSVGFWLSATASWALCSVVHVNAPNGLRRQAANFAAGPLAASVATLPILLWTFHEWSPVAPFANAVLGPVMTLMFPVAYLFAGLASIPGPWGAMTAWIPGIGLDLSLSIVHRIATVAPQVHLDGRGMSDAVMIALPCIALLFAWSRDGERWLRIARRVV
jgi:competence protein ComEC